MQLHGWNHGWMDGWAIAGGHRQQQTRAGGHNRQQDIIRHVRTAGMQEVGLGGMDSRKSQPSRQQAAGENGDWMAHAHSIHVRAGSTSNIIRVPREAMACVTRVTKVGCQPIPYSYVRRIDSYPQIGPIHLAYRASLSTCGHGPLALQQPQSEDQRRHAVSRLQ